MTRKRLEKSDPRQKRYDPPRMPKLESQFGFAGSWDGKARRPRVPVRPKPRQPSFGGLSESEFAALSPEEKIHVGNGGRVERETE